MPPPQTACDVPDPAPPPRFRVLGTSISATCPAQVDALVFRWIRSGERRFICVFAVDSIIKAIDHPDLQAIAEQATLVLPDGMPLVCLGRRRGFSVERCYGPDLMLRVCRDGVSRGVRHFLYGGTPDMLVSLQQRFQRKFPGIQFVGSLAPPFRELTPAEDDETATVINQARPDIVWVGLSSLKQDRWMARMRPKLDAPLFIGVGAAFLFHAKRIRQAPRWMMRLGLEWLFRLCAEPRRLWRRYLIGNTRFVFYLLRGRQ